MWQVKSTKSYKSAREQYISYNLWVSANYIVTNNSHSVNAVVEIENFPAKNLSGRNSKAEVTPSLPPPHRNNSNTTEP